MLTKPHKLILFITFVLLMGGCEDDRLYINTSEIIIPELQFKNLAVDVFSMNQQNISGKTAELKRSYGNFFEKYVSSFINRGGTRDSLYQRNMLDFISDKDMRETYLYIRKTFNETDFKQLESEITDGIKRFHYFFPSKPLPNKVVAGMFGYNYTVVYSDSTLGYGLEMYLGKDAPFYRMLNYPQYKTRLMSKEYISADLMRGWLLNEFDNTEANNTLLYHTIFYGKIYYATANLVSEKHDSIIIGYTSRQLEYCRMYEKNLWGYMADKNRLYENNLRGIQELTGEGPFTAAISKDCPPGIAKWIGWQIVKSYMKKNPDVSMERLMKEDAQAILNKSRYRP